MEEVYWKQQSRVTWLQSGDQNTRFFFFHVQVSKYWKHNLIIGLRNFGGSWTNESDGISNIAISYFEDIFCSSCPSLADFNAVTETVDHQLSNFTYSFLSRKFSADEVRITLFQMAPSKAPGPDGFSAGFYQKFWDVVGSPVTDACLGVLNRGHSLEELKKTLIILITKIDRAESMGDFRPISLYNVVYKVIAMALANRLRSANGRVGVGLVIRNSLGLVMTVGVSDVLCVINALHDHLVPCFDLGLAISYIFQLLFDINIVSFSFVHRSTYKIADALAKANLPLISELFWIESCPHSVEALVHENFPREL
ncbi:hypothetical protein ACOSQ2_026781 [Xanthoceras sorbifolium]